MVSVIQEFREKGPSPLLEFDRAVYLLLCLSYKVRKKNIDSIQLEMSFTSAKIL